jgi:hypothetical protein
MKALPKTNDTIKSPASPDFRTLNRQRLKAGGFFSRPEVANAGQSLLKRPVAQVSARNEP